MTEKRSATSAATTSVRSRLMAISRREIAHAFVQCLSETDTSRVRAARELVVTRRTVASWLDQKSAISVERILASPRLRKAFRRALCTEDHSDLSALAIRKARG